MDLWPNGLEYLKKHGAEQVSCLHANCTARRQLPEPLGGIGSTLDESVNAREVGSACSSADIIPISVLAGGLVPEHLASLALAVMAAVRCFDQYGVARLNALSVAIREDVHAF